MRCTQMMEIASRAIDEPIATIEALEAKLGRPVNADGNMTVRDGVATIPVRGPLFRYANLFTMISGATSYETLATDLQQAIDDPKVRGIILMIDSPGGEVNGSAELANMIFDARGKKTLSRTSEASAHRRPTGSLLQRVK
jgi:ClpP class serine protease